jgi:hypothetical protein
MTGGDGVGAAVMTGGDVGMAGAAGVVSFARGNATTAGAEIGGEVGVGGGAEIEGGIVSAGRSARNGACAGGAVVAASVLDSSFGLGLASGKGGGAVRRGGDARGAGGVGAGALTAGCSTAAGGDGSATGAAGSMAATCAGTTSTCRSGTSIRRSCQGKPKPGSQPWPPKMRLNSNE